MSLRDANNITSLEQLRDVLIETGRCTPLATFRSLTGGVSCIVAVVRDLGDDWIVKTPLSRLDVRDTWLVDRSRGANEAAILQLLDGELGPLRTPRLLFFDERNVILGQEYFVGPPPTYKELLLSGTAPSTLGAELAQALSALHHLSPPASLAGEGPRALFDALRLDAYYRTTASRLPTVAKALDQLIDETTTAQPRALVHGDFTPKNVLVASPRGVVVDWEVIHLGDASFDLATMTAHFALKALRSDPSADVEPLLTSAGDFWHHYTGPADRRRALRHTGAVMFSRLVGKSPVEYLNGRPSRERVARIARSALNGEFADATELTAAVGDAAKESNQ